MFAITRFASVIFSFDSKKEYHFTGTRRRKAVLAGRQLFSRTNLVRGLSVLGHYRGDLTHSGTVLHTERAEFSDLKLPFALRRFEFEE